MEIEDVDVELRRRRRRRRGGRGGDVYSGPKSTKDAGRLQ